MKPNVAWVKTQAGKKILLHNLAKARRAKARIARQRKLQARNSNGKTLEISATNEGALSPLVEAYAVGWCAAWLSSYAGSHNVSARTLAHRVGGLLAGSEGR